MEKLRVETAAIHEARDKVARLLANLQDGVMEQDQIGELRSAPKISGEDEADRKRKAHQRAAWAALEKGTDGDR